MKKFCSNCKGGKKLIRSIDGKRIIKCRICKGKGILIVLLLLFLFTPFSYSQKEEVEPCLSTEWIPIDTLPPSSCIIFLFEEPVIKLGSEYLVKYKKCLGGSLNYISLQNVYFTDPKEALKIYKKEAERYGISVKIK